MYVTWITWNSTNDSYVSYAPAPNTKTSNSIDASILSNFGARANGFERVYIDGGGGASSLLCPSCDFDRSHSQHEIW